MLHRSIFLQSINLCFVIEWDHGGVGAKVNLPLQTIVHAIRFLRQKVNGMIAFDAVFFDRKGQFKLHYPCEEIEGYCVTFGLFYQGPVLHVGILGNCDGKYLARLECVLAVPPCCSPSTYGF